MLNVTDLRSGYGPLPVLHGVDLEIASGEVVGLLGRNGAGKTTLMRALAGSLPITGGQVAVGGREVGELKAYLRARSGIAHVPQGRGIFDRLTVEENLEVGTRAAGSRDVKAALEECLRLFPDPARSARATVRHFFRGPAADAGNCACAVPSRKSCYLMSRRRAFSRT